MVLKQPKSAKVDGPLHVVVRIPRDGHPISQVVDAHRKVIDEHGVVWLGLGGLALSKGIVAKLNEQIAAGVETCVHVVQKNDKFDVFSGTVLRASLSLPAAERELVPRYYLDSGLVNFFNTWLRIDSFKLGSDSQLQKLFIPTSGNSVDFALKHGTASLLTGVVGSPQKGVST